MQTYLFIAFSSFLITLLATPLMARLAIKLDIMDHPNSPIKTHIKSTPYLGGAAVFIGFMASTVATLVLFPEHFGIKESSLLVLTGLVFALGVYDDIKPTKALVRLFIHLAVGAVAVYVGFRIETFLPDYLDYAISAIWIAGCINAMNIIDIMDGLASGVALFTCVSLVLATFLFQDVSFSVNLIFILALAGACLGFLIFNFEKASIFLGDAGSTVLGFVLGCLSLTLPFASGSTAEVFLPLLFLGVPIFDVVLVTILRIKQDMSPLMGSKDHFALRLKAMGFGVKQIVIMSWLACLLFGSMGIITVQLSGLFKILPLAVTVGMSSIVALLLAKVRMNAQKS